MAKTSTGNFTSNGVIYNSAGAVVGGAYVAPNYSSGGSGGSSTPTSSGTLGSYILANPSSYSPSTVASAKAGAYNIPYTPGAATTGTMSPTGQFTPAPPGITIGGVTYPAGTTGGQIIDIQRATGQLATPYQVASASGWKPSYEGLKTQGETIIDKQTGTVSYRPYGYETDAAPREMGSRVTTFKKPAYSAVNQAVQVNQEDQQQGFYYKLDKSIGGYLPGGYVRPTAPYNQDIKDLVKVRMAKNNISVEYTAGLKSTAGQVIKGRNTIELNPILKIFPKSDREGVIMHEYAHLLDWEQNLTLNNKNVTFSKSSDSWLDKITFGKFKNLGAPETKFDRENMANSFERYIDKPSKFKADFPAQAAIFEEALGYEGGAMQSTYQKTPSSTQSYAIENAVDKSYTYRQASTPSQQLEQKWYNQYTGEIRTAAPSVGGYQKLTPGWSKVNINPETNKPFQTNLEYENYLKSQNIPYGPSEQIDYSKPVGAAGMAKITDFYGSPQTVENLNLQRQIQESRPAAGFAQTPIGEKLTKFAEPAVKVYNQVFPEGIKQAYYDTIAVAGGIIATGTGAGQLSQTIPAFQKAVPAVLTAENKYLNKVYDWTREEIISPIAKGYSGAVGAATGVVLSLGTGNTLKETVPATIPAQEFIYNVGIGTSEIFMPRNIEQLAEVYIGLELFGAGMRFLPKTTAAFSAYEFSYKGAKTYTSSTDIVTRQKAAAGIVLGLIPSVHLISTKLGIFSPDETLGLKAKPKLSKAELARIELRDYGLLGREPEWRVGELLKEYKPIILDKLKVLGKDIYEPFRYEGSRAIEPFKDIARGVSSDIQINVARAIDYAKPYASALNQGILYQYDILKGVGLGIKGDIILYAGKLGQLGLDVYEPFRYEIGRGIATSKVILDPFKQIGLGVTEDLLFARDYLQTYYKYKIRDEYLFRAQETVKQLGLDIYEPFRYEGARIGRGIKEIGTDFKNIGIGVKEDILFGKDYLKYGYREFRDTTLFRAQENLKQLGLDIYEPFRYEVTRGVEPFKQIGIGVYRDLAFTKDFLGTYYRYKIRDEYLFRAKENLKQLGLDVYEPFRYETTRAVKPFKDIGLGVREDILFGKDFLKYKYRYLRDNQIFRTSETIKQLGLDVYEPFRYEGSKIIGNLKQFDLTYTKNIFGEYEKIDIFKKQFKLNEKDYAKIFYHGTKGDLAPNILKEGLKPAYITGKGNYAAKWEKGNIYLAEKLETAKWYSEMGISDLAKWGLTKLPKYQPEVFKVGLTKKQLRLLSEDQIVKGEFIYKNDVIPPNQIELLNGKTPFNLNKSLRNIDKTNIARFKEIDAKSPEPFRFPTLPRIPNIFDPVVERLARYVPDVTVRTLETPASTKIMAESFGITEKELLLNIKNQKAAQGIELEIPSKKIRILGLETGFGKAAIFGTYVGGEGLRTGGQAAKILTEYISSYPKSTELKLATALETQLVLKSLKYYPETELAKAKIAELAITSIRGQIVEGLNVQSKFENVEAFMAATERLPKKGVAMTFQFIKEKGGLVFGSKSRTADLAKIYEIKGEKYELIKVPRDIEGRFDKLSSEELLLETKEYISRLKKLGTITEGGTIFKLGTARQIVEKGIPEASVEAKVKLPGEKEEFVKVAEFKSQDGLLEKDAVSEYVLGLEKVGAPTELAGIPKTRLPEEQRGVAQGIARLRFNKGPEISGPPKRLKDIGSLSVTSRTLAMSKTNNAKFMEYIEQFESLYPEKLVREQVKKVLEEPQLLADYSKTPSPAYGTRARSLGVRATLIKTDIASPYLKEDKSPYRSASSASRSASYSASRSFSASLSKSVSASLSASPSLSASISPSLSPSPSSSKSTSPSASTSTSTSISPSPYRYKYPPYFFEKKKQKGYGTKKAKTYSVFIRRNRKFTPFATGLTRGQALRLGSEKALGTLARTFKIRETGTKEVFGADLGEDIMPNVNMFRQYQVRGGKAIPLRDTFIQKTQFNLQSLGEKAEIKAAKRNKNFNIMNF